MSSFTTTIHLLAGTLPATFVRVVNGRFPDDDPLGPEDEIPDLLVEVDYKGGWFKAGRYNGLPENCYEDEGENPEILSVMVQDEEHEPFDVLKALSQEKVRALESEAWEHQEQSARDHEPDYDRADSDW